MSKKCPIIGGTLRYVRKALSDAGYDPIVIADPEEALPMVEERRSHRFRTTLARQAETQLASDMSKCTGGVQSRGRQYRGERLCGEPRDRRQRSSVNGPLRRPVAMGSRGICIIAFTPYVAVFMQV